MNRQEWLKTGIENKWCTPPVCYTHDGLPSTKHEERLFEMGFDPCVHVIRPYSSDEEMEEILENHRPSVDNENYFL